MKYEGMREATNNNKRSVYTFSFGKEELEILVKLAEKSMYNTPKTIDTLKYCGRIRSIARTLGRVYVEEIKRAIMPTRRTHRWPLTIKKLMRKI